MVWHGYIAIPIFFAIWAGARSTLTPETKIAYQRLTSEREVVNQTFTPETKIVNLDWFGDMTKEDMKILQSYGRKKGLMKKLLGAKDSGWIPKLMLLFQVKNYTPNSNEWFSLLQNLSIPNGKCFLAERENCEGGYSMSLRRGAASDCVGVGSMESSRISGCILPEALFKKFNAGIIYIPMQMFQSNRSLFSRNGVENKKLFEKYFGWKAEIPIKLAFIFSQGKHDGNLQRSQEVFDWLKTFPEHRESYIEMQSFAGCNVHLAAGNDNDMAILLMGGDDIIVTRHIMDHGFSRNDSLLQRMEYWEEELKEWKTDIVDNWPKTSQKIVFLTASRSFDDQGKAFKNVFGDHVQLIVVPEWTGWSDEGKRSYHDVTFYIVGFL